MIAALILVGVAAPPRCYRISHST